MGAFLIFFGLTFIGLKIGTHEARKTAKLLNNRHFK